MNWVREVEPGASFAPAEGCRAYSGYLPPVDRARSVVRRLNEAETGLADSSFFLRSVRLHVQKERLLLALAASESNIGGAGGHGYHG